MRRYIAWVVLTASLVVCAGVVSIVSWWFMSGGSVLSIATSSMLPAIHPGDAVLVHKIYSDSVHPGNVISYHSSTNVVVPITHRVVAVNKNQTFTTKGDALGTADPLVGKGQIIGRVVAVAPHLGTVLGVIRKPYVLAVLVYTPVALIAIMELGRLQREWRIPTYLYRRHLKS